MSEQEMIVVELLAVAIFECDGDRAAAWRAATDESRTAMRAEAEKLSAWLSNCGVSLSPKMARAKTALRDIITVPAHRAYELTINLD